MIIRKSRINSVDKYFKNTDSNKEFYICVPADKTNLELLELEDSLEGIRVIPNPIGPVTRFNLYGKEWIHKEMDKEPRQIERDYHIIDWHGNDHYGTCFQTRMCYPKDVLLPPLVGMIFEKNKLRSDLIEKNDEEILKHTINLFLEVFGYCEVLDKDANPIVEKTKIKELKWRILPPGKYPWERVEKTLNNYFDNAPGKNKKVLKNNHKLLATYEPDFLAIGENSFNGYVVYGYVDCDLFVFESNQPGNATYIFKGEWENASQLTKYDIIQGNLCYKRVVHTNTWETTIRKIFI